MRIFAYSLLLVLASCGTSNIRQLNCTVTSPDSPGFGNSEEFIIDVKTGDRYFLRDDVEGLFLGPTKQMMSVDANSIKYESKIVGDVYMYIYRIGYGSSGAFRNAYSIDLKSLYFTREWSGMAANISSEGVCEWSEPVTTKMAAVQ